VVFSRGKEGQLPSHQIYSCVLLYQLIDEIPNLVPDQKTIGSNLPLWRRALSAFRPGLLQLPLVW